MDQIDAFQNAVLGTHVCVHACKGESNVSHKIIPKAIGRFEQNKWEALITKVTKWIELSHARNVWHRLDVAFLMEQMRGVGNGGHQSPDMQYGRGLYYLQLSPRKKGIIIYSGFLSGTQDRSQWVINQTIWPVSE